MFALSEEVSRSMAKSYPSSQIATNTWHLEKEFNLLSKASSNRVLGSVKGLVICSHPQMPYHGQLFSCRDVRSWTYWFTTSSIAFGERVLLICTITLALHLPFRMQYIDYIWHCSVFKATLIHPLEAHSTGLSFGGIANHLNTVNVAIHHTSSDNAKPSLSLYCALSIGLKGIVESILLRFSLNLIAYRFQR